jgi:hypothetical protein
MANVTKDFAFEIPVMVNHKHAGDLLIQGIGYFQPGEERVYDAEVELVTFHGGELTTEIISVIDDTKKNIDAVAVEHVEWLFNQQAA